MAEIVYDINFTPTLGSLGTLVEYKTSDSSTWLTPSSPANPTTLATYPLPLETGNSYNIRVSSVSTSCAPRYRIINVTVSDGEDCCPDGFDLSPDGSYCFQEDEVAPTIIDSGFCLADSQLASQYSGSGTYIYDPGYSTQLVGTRTLLTTEPQWKEQSGQVLGPMNREGVWVDSDCDGTKDPLTVGQELQITYPLFLASPQTFYIGMGGDNAFKLVVNGTTVVECTIGAPAGGGPVGDNFNFFHVFPVNLESGTNYLNFSGIGDGSTNDSLAVAVYENTAAEIIAATDDSQLTIPFKTSDLDGSPIDIATCPGGYFLDTSDGPGNYTCRQITTTATIPC